MVVVRKRSEFYDCHSLRSVGDGILFESKGCLVFSTPLFSVSQESSYSHGDFRGFFKFLQTNYCDSTSKYITAIPFYDIANSSFISF
jgi:hypothetical protein